MSCRGECTGLQGSYRHVPTCVDNPRRARPLCSWCGKRRQTKPVRTSIDHAPGIRTAGEVCIACFGQLHDAKFNGTNHRPGDVVRTDTAIGRIAELHFLPSPYAIIETDDGRRLALPLSALTEVESVMLPRLLWCGVAMTIDHVELRKEAA